MALQASAEVAFTGGAASHPQLPFGRPICSSGFCLLGSPGAASCLTVGVSSGRTVRGQMPLRRQRTQSPPRPRLTFPLCACFPLFRNACSVSLTRPPSPLIRREFAFSGRASSAAVRMANVFLPFVVALVSVFQQRWNPSFCCSQIVGLP